MKTIIDQEAARELELYTENTRRIYDAYTVPTIRNLTRKAKAGTYDKAKACKAWEHVAEAAARLYCEEFAEPSAWHVVFNAATRRAVAESLEASYKAEYIDAGYEVLNMGKYLDMWYGDSPRDADKIDICFSDLDCIYRGNIYKNGRIIGDYAAKEAAQIEKMFPQLIFNWA